VHDRAAERCYEGEFAADVVVVVAWQAAVSSCPSRLALLIQSVDSEPGPQRREPVGKRMEWAVGMSFVSVKFDIRAQGCTEDFQSS